MHSGQIGSKHIAGRLALTHKFLWKFNEQGGEETILQWKQQHKNNQKQSRRRRGEIRGDQTLEAIIWCGMRGSCSVSWHIILRDEEGTRPARFSTEAAL
jgi:hypothetical protein